jgi:hypothetical protein
LYAAKLRHEMRGMTEGGTGANPGKLPRLMRIYTTEHRQYYGGSDCFGRGSFRNMLLYLLNVPWKERLRMRP